MKKGVTVGGSEQAVRNSPFLSFLSFLLLSSLSCGSLSESSARPSLVCLQTDSTQFPTTEQFFISRNIWIVLENSENLQVQVFQVIIGI